MADDLELHLLNDYQRGFPLGPRPFAAIARQLRVDEELVLTTLARLSAEGKVSRVGAVFRPHRVGDSTLAAIAVAPERLETVAELVSAYPEVNHNYQREHRFNLWFVVTAPDRYTVRRVLAEIEERSGCPVLYLPMLEDYHIDLGFDLTGRFGHRASEAAATAAVTRPNDDILIGAIQEGLPLVSRPFAEVGHCADMHEAYVIGRLREMLAAGTIKRFGVVVRHHELGFRANAMAVWDVPNTVVDELGRCLSRYPFITLCYRRQRQAPAWPYNLYCMIHGRDRETVHDHLERLRTECELDAYAHELLFSLRRFKQRGARYASTPLAQPLVLAGEG